jgi:hypothetical protein
MRFVILVAGGLATGALSVGALQVSVPQDSQMGQAVRALGGNLTNIELTDISPLKAYDDVKRQISSGNIGSSLNLGTSKSIPTVSPSTMTGLGNNLHLDDAAMKRAVAAGINSQVQQGIRRAEDMSAYTRNPSAWRGMPPH